MFFVIFMHVIDCHIWKFPRADAADTYDSITPNYRLNFLKNGQEISVEGADVRCLHTPGHTTDHIVLILKEDGSLFSGDCILGKYIRLKRVLDFIKITRILSFYPIFHLV